MTTYTLTKVENGNNDDLAAIADNHKDNPTPLWIDIDKRYTDNTGISFTEGIDLIKWLRVKHFYKHIVATSFLPLSYWLKMKPSNAILGSKGITFIQQPNDRFLNGKFTSIKELEDAEPDALKAYFRVEFDLKKIRHDEANIYGLQKLIECHDKVADKKETLTIKIKEDLEYSIFNYLFALNSSGYSQEIIKKAKTSLTALRERELYNVSNPKVPNVIYIDDMADKGWENLLRLIIYGDEKENINFIVLAIEKTETVDTLSKKIIDNLYFKDANSQGIFPELIITDLKLLATEKELHSYEEYLSIKVFRKIMTDFSNIIINKRYNLKWMFFTASNNLSLFKAITTTDDYKPNAFFIKQGADMMLDNELSMQNYISLLDTLKMFFIKSPTKKKINLDKLKIESIERTYKVNSALDKISEKLKKNDVGEKKFGFLEDKDSIVIDTNIFIEFSTKFNNFQFSNFLNFLIIFKDKIIINHAVKCELKSILERERKGRVDLINEKILIIEWFLDFIKEFELKIDDYRKTYYEGLKDNMKEEEADRILIDFIKEKINIEPTTKIVLLSLDRKREAGKEGPAFVFDKEEFKDNVYVLPNRGHNNLEEYLNTGAITTRQQRQHTNVGQRSTTNNTTSNSKRSPQNTNINTQVNSESEIRNVFLKTNDKNGYEQYYFKLQSGKIKVIDKIKITNEGINNLIENKAKLIGKKIIFTIKDVDLIAFIKNNIK